MEHAAEFQSINDEIARLKTQKTVLLEQQQKDSAASRRIADAMGLLTNYSAEITEWDEARIRQLVEAVKVLSEDRVLICLCGGIEIERHVEKG